MSEQASYRPGYTTSSLAVVSMVFGILAWCLLPFVGALVAIICGHMARSEIRHAGPDTRIEGDGILLPCESAKAVNATRVVEEQWGRGVPHQLGDLADQLAIGHRNGIDVDHMGSQTSHGANGRL